MTIASLEELILDYTLYPRSQVSDTHVSALADILRAGGTLPPINVDKKTKRVADGFHRIGAYRDVGLVEIEVDYTNYRNDGEILRAALRANAGHGRPFSPYDRTRAVSLAANLGVTITEVADDLGMTVETIQTLSDTRRAYGPRNEPITLKNSVAPFMRGKTLTPQQKEANLKLDGMRPLYHVNQLILLLETEMVEWTEPFAAGAARLHALLEKGEP